MRQPVLLCYNLSRERAQGILMAAARLRIRVRHVARAEYGLPLSVLCGVDEAGDEMNPTAPREAEGFEEEMLVMAFFPSSLVSLFLQTMRRMNVPPVALKAILTPTNAAWDSDLLHAELAAEHEAMARAKAPKP